MRSKSQSRSSRDRNRFGTSPSQPPPSLLLPMVASFLSGCILATAVLLYVRIETIGDLSVNSLGAVTVPSSSSGSPLLGLRILVAIAAFDFSQLPHLEEVLDSYQTLCAAGSLVDVVIHTTVVYPVTLIDLLNSRLHCTNPHGRFTVTMVLKPKHVRLHLVDFHRTLFYDRINDYDLFVYTEDDIRVTPTTIATYLYETDRVAQRVGRERASDFNVGIARYEYNYPPDMVIDDKSRHVTQNVTRVYWEHVWKPAIPKSVDAVPQAPLSQHYVHMLNHHQGMYMATRALLLAWKERPNCQFDVVRDRPGLKKKPSQHAEGTQRVWMSSQMLYGERHCNVQQVIPMDKFGMLTVLHLPNKNYRRVGKSGRVGMDRSKNETKVERDDSLTFEGPSKLLLSAMELHIDIRQRWPAEPQFPYRGIQIVNQIGDDWSELVQQRLLEFKAYVKRGGVMSEEDMTRVDLE